MYFPVRVSHRSGIGVHKMAKMVIKPCKMAGITITTKVVEADCIGVGTRAHAVKVTTILPEKV